MKKILSSYRHIMYTLKHYVSFLKTEKRLLGYYKYKFHDLDKVLMYLFLPFLGTKKIKKIHVKNNKHHIKESKSVNECNYEEAIIDWECSRFTKEDKPLTAREVTVRFHSKSKHFKELISVLEKLKL